MNPLETVFRNYAYDYFGRLGGSGRYGNFYDWHPAALVLMIATGVKPPQSPEWNKLYDGSDYLPSAIWRKTDKMPYQVYEKLKEIKITQLIFDDFISHIKFQLSKNQHNGIQQLSQFENLLAEQEVHLTSFFSQN
jgi:hypothetical protein